MELSRLCWPTFMKFALQGFKPITVLERLPQLAATHWLVNHLQYSNTATLCYIASNSPQAREGQPAGSYGLQHILNPNPSLKCTLFLNLCNSKQLQKYTCITLRCLEATETSTTCLLSKNVQWWMLTFCCQLLFFSFSHSNQQQLCIKEEPQRQSLSCPSIYYLGLVYLLSPPFFSKKETLDGYFLHSCHIVENRKKMDLEYNPISKQGFSVLGCFREIFYLNGYRSRLKETSATPEDFHATIVRPHLRLKL